jgi:type II secretory pathway predicted ATPase ExeA
MSAILKLDHLQHPATKAGRLCFDIGPCREALDEFSDLSTSGDLSMTIHGAFRSGKTTLMRYVLDHFKRTKTMAVFYSFQSEGVSRFQSGGVSRRRLTSAEGMPRLARQLRTSFTGTTPLRAGSEAEALLNVVLVEADKLGTDRVLFLIDEGQYLSLEQLIGLKALMESLISKGLSPFVLLFGQPEILALKKDLIALGQTSLVDRFFLNLFRLRGLLLKEVEPVLKNFDTHRWPKEDGPTYTQFFLPDLWNRGTTLASQAPSFRRSLLNVCREYRRDPDDVPVKYLIHATCRTLRVGAKLLAQGKTLGEIIDESVARSGIVEAFKDGDLVRVAHEGPQRGRRKVLVE